MKGKISLYIGNRLADMAEDALILFNYDFSDLENPVAVKNGYSKQITLPGTSRNDEIFGHFYRTDRVTGAGFNALARTPYIVQDGRGNILQRGYVKLDKVTRKGRGAHAYVITMYGQLGSFLYGLMYDEAGNKRTLADLEYYHSLYDEHGEEIGSELMDLTRNISVRMLMEAWGFIDLYKPETALAASGRVLNWMPSYNGLPDSFDADKVLVSGVPAGGGIPSSIEDDSGKVYRPHNGWSLLKLPKAYTEWQIRDLRSYNQRPILNVMALLDAISLPQNNGGYAVNWRTRPPHEEDLWLTLRKPCELSISGGVDTKTYTDEALRVGFCPMETNANYSMPIQGGGQTTIALTLSPALALEGPLYPYRMYEAWDRVKRGTVSTLETCAAATFMQVVGLDSMGNVKAASAIYAFSNATARKTLAEVVQDAWNDRATPAGFFEGDTIVAVEGSYQNAGGNAYTWDAPVSVNLVGQQVSAFAIRVARASDENQQEDGAYGYYMQTTWNNTKGTSPHRAGFDGTLSAVFSGSITSEATEVHSFVDVTQAEFLGGTQSPADYLLGLAKMYGWVLTCDDTEKEVTVWSRNEFFDDSEGEIDLSARIDASRDIEITPVLAASRIYDFSAEAIGGRAVAYKKRYGREYGAYRADTGYEFGDAEINLMDGAVFKTAVPWLDRGKVYAWPYVGTKQYLNFEEAGYQITMGDPRIAGGAYTKEIPPITPTRWASYSAATNFADAGDKLQFQDDEQKEVAGEDCLVYLRPWQTWGDDSAEGYSVHLTDDNDVMYYLNGDKPCWIYTPFTLPEAWLYYSFAIPRFAPVYEDDDAGQYWLTFGIPKEIYDPLIASIQEDGTLYARYWRAYIRDRYDKDTKVLKCRVDLSGLKVGPELMRRFFYYDGSLWVLNKISNYSLTTWDAAECEFVQVRDIENYINGQII